LLHLHAYKLLDAVMTAHVHLAAGGAGGIAQLFARHASSHARVAAMVFILQRLVPGVLERACRSLLVAGGLPFAPVRVELMDFGSGSTVFRMTVGSHLRVLKVYRRSLGRRRETLLTLAAYFKAKHDALACWYAGPLSPVLASSFLVLRGPLLGRPAVAVVQPLVVPAVPGRRDALRDFTDEDLVALMESPGFRARFRFFAERTLALAETHRRAPDMLGKENLMMAGGADGARLALIDFGMADLDTLRQQAPADYARLQAVLSRLERLLARARALDAGPAAGRIQES
jgi:hypothetical protein